MSKVGSRDFSVIRHLMVSLVILLFGCAMLAADDHKSAPKAAAPAPGFLEQAGALDSRLHDLIASSCRNTFLANELGRLKILFRAFRDVDLTSC